MDAVARARVLALAGIVEFRATAADAGGGGGGGKKTAHEPAGSPKGGQFTSRPGSGGGQQRPKVAPGHRRPKSATPGAQSTPQAPATPRLVKEGDSGEDVRYAQYAMSLLGFQVAQDGRFGPETAAAVKQIQQRLGVKHPNGHLTPALLHKMQDAVRLSPCVGGQRDLAFEAEWEQRDEEFEDGDLDFDETAEAVLDALDEVERSADWAERAAHDVSKELRIPSGKGGGRWTKSPITAAIAHALEEWAKGDGPDDPFVFDGKPIDREPLRKAAVARGITLKRGASREDIVAALKGDLKVKVRDAKAAKSPDAGKPVRFTLSGGGANAHDVQLENDIRAAYRKHGKDGDYVGLAEIRDELGTKYSRTEVDAALKRLAIEPATGANIVPQSNQKALTAADRAAALHIGNQERHFIHFEDSSPRPVPDAKLRNLDVGVFTEPNGKLSLWEVSDSGERRRRVALADDLAGLEKWASDNGESQLADWARKERGGAAPKREAPFGYKFPRDQALLDAQIDEQIKGIDDDLAIEGASAKATTVRIHARMKRMRLFPEGTGEGLHYVWKRPGGDVRLDDSSPTADPEILAARRLADAAVAAEKSVTAPDIPAKATPAAKKAAPAKPALLDEVYTTAELDKVRPEVSRLSFSPEGGIPASTFEQAQKQAQNIAPRWKVSDADLRALQQVLGSAGGSTSGSFEERRNSLLETQFRGWQGSGGGAVAVTAMAGLLGSDDGLNAQEREQVAQIRSNPAAQRAAESLGRSVYDATQEWFREQGVTHVRAFRGTSDVEADRRRPWTSWSLSPASTRPEMYLGEDWSSEAAQRLDQRSVRVRDIPIEEVFSIPPSGFGTYYEQELVVLRDPPDVPAKATPAAKKAAGSVRERTKADMAVAGWTVENTPSIGTAEYHGVSLMDHIRTLDREPARDQLDLLKVGSVDEPNTLKGLLKSQKLPVSGRKRELVDRLVEHTHGGGGTAAATAVRPSGLPTDRKLVSGDFDDLASRLIGKSEQQILETIADLNATELARLARKFPGPARTRSTVSSARGGSRGLQLPDDMTLQDRKLWLAQHLTSRRNAWRSTEWNEDEIERADEDFDEGDDPTLDEIHAMAAEDKPNTASRARELALLGVTRALGHDVTPGHDRLHHYWTRGKGRALWEDSPTPWRTLYALVTAAVRKNGRAVSPEQIRRWVSRWFIEVKHYAAGSDVNRVVHGMPPRGHRVGPG